MTPEVEPKFLDANHRVDPEWMQQGAQSILRGLGMTANLADRDCVAARAGTHPLSAGEIQPYLEQLTGWNVEDGKLYKPYGFPNFVQAVDFVNRITEVAEDQDHHPDLYVRWGEVRAYLWTHSIDGLHDSDFIMAAKIDQVYEIPPSKD